MKEYLAILRSCPLFAGVEEGELLSMLQCLNARVIRMEKEEALFREGEPALSVGVVLSGAARILREDFFGNRTVLGQVEPYLEQHEE